MGQISTSLSVVNSKTVLVCTMQFKKQILLVYRRNNRLDSIKQTKKSTICVGCIRGPDRTTQGVIRCTHPGYIMIGSFCKLWLVGQLKSFDKQKLGQLLIVNKNKALLVGLPDDVFLLFVTEFKSFLNEFCFCTTCKLKK